MARLVRLIFLGAIALSMPAAMAQDAPSTAAAAPIAAATTPAALTAPVLVGADKINSGDTAWLLASTALVLLMTVPGLA